jgi:hypothetical protein
MVQSVTIFGCPKRRVEMFRQGDVLIIPVKSIPKTALAVERNGDVVLAYGEVTGHAHAIKSERAALFSDPKLAAIFMCVTDDPVALEHEEHGTVTIPPGGYEVRRQKEYTPSEIRQVAD